MKHTHLYRYISLIFSFSHFVAWTSNAQNNQVSSSKDPLNYTLTLQVEDAQNGFVLPGDIELVHKASNKIVAVKYNATSLQFEAQVIAGQAYDVRASMNGYYTQREIFVFEKPKDNKPPIKSVKLDPTGSNVVINAVDATSNMPLKLWRVTLTEVHTGRVITFVVDTPDGVVRMYLLEGREYRIELYAPTYELNKESFTKAGGNQSFTLQMVPRKAAYIAVKAVEKESNLPIAAIFKVSSPQKKKPLEGKTSLDAPNFTIEVQDESPLTVEIEAEGYAPVSQQISGAGLQSGEVKEMTIPLKSILYPLAIRVLDAETKKPIEKSIVRVTDLTLGEIRPVTKLGVSQFNVMMKRRQDFEVTVKADGYNVLVQKFDKWPDKGQVSMLVSKRHHATVMFTVVDATSNKPVKAQLSIKPQSTADKELFADCSEAQMTTYGKEVYTIETIADKYQPKQSTFNMADFENGKKYPFVIRLDKALTKVAIKAIDKKNQDVINVNSYVLYAESDPQTKIEIERTNEGEASAMLVPEKGYRIEMMAEGYERFVQNFKIAEEQQQLVCAMNRTSKALQLVVSIRDSVSNKPLEAKVIATNKEHTWEDEKRAVSGSMEVHLPLPSLGIYQVSIEAKGYYTRQVELNVNSMEKALKQVVLLNKLPKEEAQELQDSPDIPVWQTLYFEQSSYGLPAETFVLLDQLAARMLVEKNLRVEVGGHTDNVGDPKLNLALSENRAKVIFNYLVNKGVPENRVFYKGYGGQRPIVSNDSEDNKKKNRRVELKLKNEPN